jgi:UDPglucose 6-dehydrogenase
MTKIGFIGLGKLGLPTCYTYAYLGHRIMGYDINSKRMTYDLDTIEAGLSGKGSINELFKDNENIKNNLSFSTNLEEVINFGDIIFVAIQTPHDKKFEGIERLTPERKDFDYTYLVNSIKDISSVLDKLNTKKIVSIISTVLPGTIRKYIFPHLSKNIKLCYNPYFIAMGTVARDLVSTEFVLLGSVNDDASKEMIKFYKTITDAPVHKTTLENAELIKVTYNTFIGTKIVLANNIMEMCDKLPNTNCDDVIDALSLANRRILSSQYLRGGMGDGGGCHPRDGIALSWLSNNLDLSVNFSDMIMTAREKQTEYLSRLIVKYHLKNKDLPIYLLGKAFKANTAIMTGSPAILLKNILEEMEVILEDWHDPLVDERKLELKKGIYCLAVNHDIFKDYHFPKDSIVIDPFRYITQQDITLHGIGDN